MQTRKGRISILGPTLSFEHEKLIEIFYQIKFLPLSITIHPTKDCYQYMGISEYFEPVEIGQWVPEYFIEVQELEDGKIKAKIFK